MPGVTVAEKLTTLESWATKVYGDHAPSIYTLRRWVRDAKIFPIPKKHGRTYFVEETAQYIQDYNS
jgi:Excisionase-like protein